MNEVKYHLDGNSNLSTSSLVTPETFYKKSNHPGRENPWKC